MLAGSQAQGFSERRPFPGKAQVELRPESCLTHSPGDPTIHLAEQNVTRMLITPRAVTVKAQTDAVGVGDTAEPPLPRECGSWL